MQYILLALLVVVDPYKDLDYEKTNVYDINPNCYTNCVNVIESEDSEFSSSEIEEEDIPTPLKFEL